MTVNQQEIVKKGAMINLHICISPNSAINKFETIPLSHFINLNLLKIPNLHSSMLNKQNFSFLTDTISYIAFREYSLYVDLWYYVNPCGKYPSGFQPEHSSLKNQEIYHDKFLAAGMLIEAQKLSTRCYL